MKSLNIFIFTFVILIKSVTYSNANDLSEVLMAENQGCLTGPTEQFGRYLGDWTMRDYRLAQDGTTWEEQNGARWNFKCVGNGIAVQDFWMPNDGGVGTSLRIYSPETSSWDIAWTSTSANGYSHISAKEQESGNIVMHYITPEQSPPRRITFFPPTDNGWNWQLELSFDDQKTWTAVYKMTATPSK